MQRRQFLQTAAALAATGTSTRLFALPKQNEHRYLIIFLRGGYDAASVLIPISSELYYESRPNIAIPRDQAIELTPHWGLHPALKDTIYPLVQKGEAGFIPFAGIPNVSRSHFDAQDRWELGLDGLADKKSQREGILYRIAQQMKGSRPIAFTTSRPLAFAGEKPIPNMVLRSAMGATQDQKIREDIESMYAEHTLEGTLKTGFMLREKTEGKIKPEKKNSLALDARKIATLMKHDFNLGFLDIGGWDTHYNQGNSTGALSKKLAELGSAISTFIVEMDAEWNKTTILITSEFGRTFRENGSKGTDHGYGTNYWLLSGDTNKTTQKIDYKKISTKDIHLHKNRDYPVLIEHNLILKNFFS